MSLEDQREIGLVGFRCWDENRVVEFVITLPRPEDPALLLLLLGELDDLMVGKDIHMVVVVSEFDYLSKLALTMGSQFGYVRGDANLWYEFHGFR